MKPIFIKKSSIQFRFLLLIVISILTILSDSKLQILVKVRTYMDQVISPLYFLSSVPNQIFDYIFNVIKTHTHLLLENQKLQRELLLKKSEQLLFNQYKKENIQLKTLLRLPLRYDEQKIITQVISVIQGNKHQIIINKGLNHNVYIGQPVIDSEGVIGQVIAVNQFTSRVLLICDTSHFLPIQILRNDIRIIISGSGNTENLQLEPLPINTDIRVGDILVTSGLDGRFPIGYPVAVVSTVRLDVQRACAMVQAYPTARLGCLHYLLLLHNNLNNNELLSTSEVRKIAHYRLTNKITID